MFKKRPRILSNHVWTPKSTRWAETVPKPKKGDKLFDYPQSRRKEVYLGPETWRFAKGHSEDASIFADSISEMSLVADYKRVLTCLDQDATKQTRMYQKTSYFPYSQKNFDDAVGLILFVSQSVWSKHRSFSKWWVITSCIFSKSLRPQ